MLQQGNYYLFLNRWEWLENPLIKWTEEEIDGADERGFIGNKYGIDCYLSRPLPVFYSPTKNDI